MNANFIKSVAFQCNLPRRKYMFSDYLKTFEEVGHKNFPPISLYWNFQRKMTKCEKFKINYNKKI